MALVFATVHVIDKLVQLPKCLTNFDYKIALFSSFLVDKIDDLVNLIRRLDDLDLLSLAIGFAIWFLQKLLPNYVHLAINWELLLYVSVTRKYCPLSSRTHWVSSAQVLGPHSQGNVLSKWLECFVIISILVNRLPKDLRRRERNLDRLFSGSVLSLSLGWCFRRVQWAPIKPSALLRRSIIKLLSASSK